MYIVTCKCKRPQSVLSLDSLSQMSVRISHPCGISIVRSIGIDRLGLRPFNPCETVNAMHLQLRTMNENMK